MNFYFTDCCICDKIYTRLYGGIAQLGERLNGIQDKKQIKRNVMKLSGGQQQRVAIARALVSNAPIILADEPTGNLDSVTAGEIIDILKTLAKDKNKCVIVVTHSKEVADSADIILELSGKKLKKVNKMNLEVE